MLEGIIVYKWISLAKLTGLESEILRIPEQPAKSELD